MKKTYYFSHDYNARNDEKILGLVYKLSWSGYGLYWAIVEMLYESDGYLENEYERIAFALRTDKDSIIDVIENHNLFVIEGNKFYSNSVLERLQRIKEKSEKARESVNKRWGNTNVIPIKYDGNTIKERKGKESKRNIILESTPSKVAQDFFSNQTRQQEIIDQIAFKLNSTEQPVRNEIIKFISYWTEPNKLGTKQRWQTEKTFEVSRRLANWFSRANQFSDKNKTINLDNL